MYKVGIVLAALLMISSAQSVFSQPQQHQRRMEQMMERRGAIMDKLQLTDAQKDQMRKLHLDLQKKETTIQSKIRLTRLDIRELFLAEKPDRNAIEKLMKMVSDLQYQAKVIRLDHMFAVKEILTPEQQKIMKEHLRDGFGGRRGWGQGMGMDPQDHGMMMDPQDHGMMMDPENNGMMMDEGRDE